MLNHREWSAQSVLTRPDPPFYIFVSSLSDHPDDLCMTSSEDQLASYGSEEWIYPEQEIIRILVDHFKSIPQVEAICASFGPQEITIWTLLESYDREAREKVYGKELEICRTLGIYDFDFRATSIDLISSEELINTGSHEIYRRH